jgi:hypothetical protein
LHSAVPAVLLGLVALTTIPTIAPALLSRSGRSPTAGGWVTIALSSLLAFLVAVGLSAAAMHLAARR